MTFALLPSLPPLGPLVAFAANAFTIGAGLFVGVGCCVMARWLWKKEEKETK